jgi:hypothetical protein
LSGWFYRFSGRWKDFALPNKKLYAYLTSPAFVY